MASSKINRKKIYNRDGRRCHICQCKIKSIQDMTLDHLIPTSKGGPDVEWNVSASHGRCNNARGAGRFETQASRIAYAIWTGRYPRQAYDGIGRGLER